MMAAPLLAQAQQAWEQVLGQLRYTLNRADFETWLRDARPLAYDGQVLTVGVANAYARDWLTDRLRTTLEQQLRGILNAPIQVVFRVTSPATAASPNGTTVPQPHKPRAPSSPSTSPQTAAAPPTNWDLQALSLRLRDAFVQPQRIVFLPGYFLRWLPYLGSRAGWLYVALRQTYFLANVAPYGPGQRIPAGQALEVPRAALAHWSHLTKRTINNILNQGLLSPLVTVERNRHRDAHRQAPNRYIFTADLPLTPNDLASTLAALEAYGLTSDPVAALAYALQQPPQNLLSPTLAPSPDLPPLSPPVSLRTAVSKRLRGRGLSGETFAKVLGMAELLETSLIDAEGKLFISWYFIEHHLPALGHTVAWLYLAARHRAQRHGKMAANGFRTLQVTSREVAGWLGLKKARYGRDLIPVCDQPAAPATHAPAAAAFLHRAAGRGNAFTLFVQTLEPLTPADQEAYQLALRALAASIQHDDCNALRQIQQAYRAGNHPMAQNRLLTLIHQADPATPPASPSHETLQRALEALAQVAISQTTTADVPKISSRAATQPTENSQKFPPEPPNFAHGSAKNFPQPRQFLPTEPAKNFPHLNHVNPPSPPENLEKTHLTQAGGEKSLWAWNDLLPHLDLAPQIAQQLQNQPAWHFVSWLLYATAHHKQLDNPLGFAIHKTLQGHPATGPWAALAQSAPEDLHHLLQRHLQYGIEAVLAIDGRWEPLQHASSAALLQLATWLGLTVQALGDWPDKP